LFGIDTFDRRGTPTSHEANQLGESGLIGVDIDREKMAPKYNEIIVIPQKNLFASHRHR